MKKVLIITLTIILSFSLLFAEDKTDKTNDEQAIKEASLNYIEGWYTGNAERMDKALHPELAKRRIATLPTGGSFVNSISKTALVEYTRAAYGTKTPKDILTYEVIILDIDENIASVKINSTEFIDYVHLAKIKDEWKILNVIWRSTKKK